MNAPAQLVPRFGIAADQAYTLTQRITTIGRENINDIPLPDSEVSRRHARIAFDNGNYTLEDLGSTNGTFVDGEQIHAPTPLKNGMTIDFGEKHRFTFIHEVADNHDQTMIDPRPQAFDATMIDPMIVENDATMVDIAPDSQLAVPTRMEAAPPPQAMPIAESPLQSEPLKTEVLVPVFKDDSPSKPAKKGRRTILGIGCLALVLIFACAATVYFLDSYQDGQLLYCGPMQGVWDALGGVIGQDLICP